MECHIGEFRLIPKSIIDPFNNIGFASTEHKIMYLVADHEWSSTILFCKDGHWASEGVRTLEPAVLEKKRQELLYAMYFGLYHTKQCPYCWFPHPYGYMFKERPEFTKVSYNDCICRNCGLDYQTALGDIANQPWVIKLVDVDNEMIVEV